MPTREELKFLQSLPLHLKVRRTQAKIIEFFLRNKGRVYISFSGGKDSTVLLDIARRMFPDIEAVFIDTGLEYPEIREFVKTIDNVTWIRPKIGFQEVLRKYGYPVVSKEQSFRARKVRNMKLTQKYMDECLKKLGKWTILTAPNLKFYVSEQCCDIMKKNPAKDFEKRSHKAMITAEMAADSFSRQTEWMENGCNAFDLKRPKSTPMSFWTTQDVLQYLLITEAPYSMAYGEIVPKSEFPGQLAMEDIPTDLMTTGCQRTGCMFCGFGAHLEAEPNRFQKMKVTHPKQYDFCMRENGLGMAKVLDYIGVKY